MFTKHGHSKQISLLKEIGAGLTLGLAVGLVWKVIIHCIPRAASQIAVLYPGRKD
jgi:hypothetical protein